MVFPHDRIQENIKAEDHSFVSIAVVSIIMIGATMGSLIISL